MSGTLTRERSGKCWSVSKYRTSLEDDHGKPIDLLRAKMPKEARPAKRRTRAKRSWVFLPTVGRKGDPAAVCQTSTSFESIGWKDRRLIDLIVCLSVFLKERYLGEEVVRKW